MRLHTRVLLIIALVTACMLAAAAAIVWPLILVNYQRLESREVEGQLQQVQTALAFQTRTLETQLADWAYWDDTYLFLKGQKPEYRARNIDQSSTYEALGIDCLGAYSRTQGPLLFLHDPETGLIHEGSAQGREVLTQLLALMGVQGNERLSGLIRLEDRLMLFSAQAVRDSSGTGESSGYLLMAKSVNEAFRHDMALISHPSLQLRESGQVPKTLEPMVNIVDSHNIEGTVFFSDIHGQPVLSATVTLERVVTLQARQNLMRILWVMVAFGSLMGLITYLALVRYVLHRIGRLRHEVSRIRDSGQLMSSLGDATGDEVGELMGDFNAMVERLAGMRNQLDRARIEAEAVNEARGRFMANMSHEIRTPMTAILGYSELLADKPGLDEQTRHYLKVIQDNSEMLLRLINDILDLSRIEVGRLSVNPVVTNVPSVVRECAGFFRERANIKQISLAVNVTGSIPDNVMMDSVRLKQILLNLIGNAVKFTERGSVKVSLSLEGKSLVIGVSDSGIGIGSKELAHIFEPFWQADTEVHQRYTGFGLGLVVSRQLARLMGGDITASSEAGQGSTFVVRLPLQLAEKSDLAQADASPVNRAVKGRVLLAEDNDVNRMLLRTLLEKLGLDVIAVTNGEEALETLLADREPVDMIFMDMIMPVVDGILATRRLRAAGFDKPIVALTASAMLDERELSFDAGCTDFASKPISQSVLQALCEKYIPQT